MQKNPVSLVRYEKSIESVRKAVELSKGFDHLTHNARVFIKPNIVFWTTSVPFPKWGVITTSRVIEDMVVLLKEHGIDHITIGEGIAANPRNKEIPKHAFETLGYGVLKKKYGVNTINVMERPFRKVDLGDDIHLNFNVDILESDFIVNLPVIKTHSQTVVSLGIKNLKGMIDVPSRKKCHSTDTQKDLNVMIAGLWKKMPPMLTLQDGIYTLERGPWFDGKAHRSNLLVASTDILAADLVSAKILGYDMDDVPHLKHAMTQRESGFTLSDIEVIGEAIESVAKHHAHGFAYQASDKGDMPVGLSRCGIEGLYYRKYDLSICTYCSHINGTVLSAIRSAWQGTPWEDVEVLTGKIMKPQPGMKKTILLGKCMCKENKGHPDIKEEILVPGCPPKSEDIFAALRKAGITPDPKFIEKIEKLPASFMARYAKKPAFDESFFRIKEI